MSNIVELYKIIQPLHKRLLQLNCNEAVCVDIGGYFVGLENNTITIDDLAYNIFRCSVPLGYKPVQYPVFHNRSCRLPFNFNGVFEDVLYRCNQWGCDNVTVKLPLSEEQYFQTSLMCDMMSHDDIVSLYGMAQDIVGDDSIMMKLHERAKKMNMTLMYPRLTVHNSTDGIAPEKYEYFVEILKNEIVPRITKLLDSFERGCK